MTGAVVVAILLAISADSALAQKKSRTEDAARHASTAAKTFTEIMNVRDKAIPKELLDKAEAIAVFPGVIKAAFIVGGRGWSGSNQQTCKGEAGALPRFSTSVAEALVRRSARRKMITCF